MGVFGGGGRGVSSRLQGIRVAGGGIRVQGGGSKASEALSRVDRGLHPLRGFFFQGLGPWLLVAFWGPGPRWGLCGVRGTGVSGCLAYG